MPLRVVTSEQTPAPGRGPSVLTGGFNPPSCFHECSLLPPYVMQGSLKSQEFVDCTQNRPMKSVVIIIMPSFEAPSVFLYVLGCTFYAQEHCHSAQRAKSLREIKESIPPILNHQL